MKITLRTFIEVAIIVLLGYLVKAQWTRDNRLIEETAYWRDKAFEVDTVYVDSIFTVKESTRSYYRDSVPPQQVTVYKPFIPENILEMKGQLLSVIDSLRGERTDISPLFLRQFPQASKLISADFGKDTLNLSLLNIGGNVTTERYPVNYNAFKYHYSDNHLRAHELKTRGIEVPTKKRPLIRYDGTHVNYDHDLLQGNHKINATIGVDAWKFRVQGYSEYPLNTPAQVPAKLEAGVRVGFRIF